MKAKTLCATALATLFLAGGTIAYAAPGDPMDTTGKVNVTDGKIETEDGVEDPEKDGKLPDIPDIVVPNPNPDMGPLEVAHAPALTFGNISTATKQVQSYAAATKFTDADGDQTRGPIVHFGDLRTTANGYTVNAKLKTQFTQGTNVLNGSTISFANPYSKVEKGATGVMPELHSFTLSEGETETVATADKTVEKSGKGMWTVEYGSSTLVGAEDTTGESVQLTVPANTASSMAGGDYTAVIEWSILAAP